MWPENPLKPKPQQKREGKIVDYLREQRIKHNEELRTTHGGNSIVNNCMTVSRNNLDWKRELTKYEDASEKEKYSIIIEKAREIEQKAKRKQ